MIDFNSFGNVESLVDFINSKDEREVIAAEYAVETQAESGYSACEDSIAYHLEFLKSAGAEFCAEEAQALALAIINKR